KHPIAIKSISKKIKKRSIANIETIHSNCKTGLASNSVDVILLYHVFNDLKNPDVVLEELHRILKPSGILSFMEFNVEGISPNITKSGLFQLQKKMDATYIFVKKIINH
ncbi:MAG: methyltransferase domain-containing protein, partial [Nitrosopumilus sp.]